MTYVELFFDLIFVFTIIQLSLTLAGHYTLLGLMQGAVLLLAVWWVWILTTWATNWLDPNRLPVQVMLFALMFLGLVLSTSIPDAFGDKAIYFAVAYVLIQVGRSLFTVLAFRGHGEKHRRNFLRMTCWLAASAPLWIIGALVEPELRLVLWLCALAIEYLAPELGYWVPRLGPATEAEWDVLGGHMAERCALFILICLGETFLASGRQFTEMAVTATSLSAFAIAFLGSVAMWWIYFRFGHRRASDYIKHSGKPGSVARVAFTYAHLPIVVGIILKAVSVEFMLSEPLGASDAWLASAVLGGPLLFLVGNLWLKEWVAGRPPVSHLAGIGLLALLVPAVPWLSAVLLNAAAVVVLIVVAAWESLAGKGPGQAG
ncbi:low temperature requirement protein A [Aquisalimonas sp.]|uniref:low temperature requirement protein A n=1 Tax=Aquisalimonas sp. TaxID=1872621 RepID=UPI0025BF82FB|nr:low temperature requirement protein A [Aquisalimonas sp.]